MNNKWKQIVAISAIAGISWLLVQNPYTQIYLTQLTDHSVASMKQEDELLLQIKESTKNMRLHQRMHE